MNAIFKFNWAKIIAKTISIHEFNIVKAFQIYKKYENINNCEFAMPHNQIVGKIT